LIGWRPAEADAVRASAASEAMSTVERRNIPSLATK
jgi:hypothetical protein